MLSTRFDPLIIVILSRSPKCYSVYKNIWTERNNWLCGTFDNPGQSRRTSHLPQLKAADAMMTDATAKPVFCPVTWMSGTLPETDVN
jgi:hypothetical protein